MGQRQAERLTTLRNRYILAALNCAAKIDDHPISMTLHRSNFWFTAPKAHGHRRDHDWHQYAPADAAQSHGKHSYAISPGFWQSGGQVRLDRDPARWAQNAATWWRRAPTSSSSPLSTSGAKAPVWGPLIGGRAAPGTAPTSTSSTTTVSPSRDRAGGPLGRPLYQRSGIATQLRRTPHAARSVASAGRSPLRSLTPAAKS